MAKRKPRKASDFRKNIDARRVRFVQQYLVDLNGTQAAIRAGYSARSAKQQATRLLSDASITAQIDAAQAEIAERNRLKIDDIVQEMRKIGFANMTHYSRLIEGGRVPDLSQATDDQMAAVSSLDVEEDIVQGSDGGARDRVEGDDGYGEEQRVVLRRRTKFRLHDKGTALYRLGMHLGGFGATLNVNQNVNLNVTLTRDEIRALPEAAIGAIIDGVASAVEERPGAGKADSEDRQG